MGGAALVQSNHGVVTVTPRPAATTCVLYQGDPKAEVLMVRRSRSARFMAGAWAFPGGAVEREDHDAEHLSLIGGLADGSPIGPWLAAAFREVVEETGLWLTDPPRVEPVGSAGVYDVARRKNRIFTGERAAYFANWVTPSAVPVRFDARFFVVAVDTRLVPEPDGREVDAAEFVTPNDALHRAESGQWLVPFPTLRVLDQLRGISNVEAAITDWGQRPVERIEPRLRVREDGVLEAVMPGDPGFDDLADAEPDPGALAAAARAAVGHGRRVAEVAGDED